MVYYDRERGSLLPFYFAGTHYYCPVLDYSEDVDGLILFEPKAIERGRTGR